MFKALDATMAYSWAHTDGTEPDVVTAIEEKYIFFAQKADIARKEVMPGHSCVFNVYFR